MKTLAQSWLGGLSARERLLLAAAGGLVLVLAATSLVVTPLRAAHETARLDYEGAALDLAEARGAAAFAKSADRRPSAGEGDARAAVTGSALARGLAIARLSPVDGGGLAVRLERADPGVLYAWIADLETSQGVTVRRASVRRLAGSDAVEADLVLGGAS